MALSNAEYQKLSDPQFNKLLYGMGFKLSKNHATAEDLVQQTIVKILENQDKFNAGTNFQGWANTILRNTFFSQNRKRKREILTGGDAGDDDDPLSQALNNRSVKGNQMVHLELEETLKALDHLVPEHREAIDLIFVEQMSYEDAAIKLDVAVGTVKSRVFRARAQLVEIMEDPEAFNISLSPRDAGVNTLSRKVGTIIEGFYSAPKPQKLSLPKAPKSNPVRSLNPVKAEYSTPVKKPAKQARQGKYHLALNEALKKHGIDGNHLDSDKFSEIIDHITAKSDKQKRAVIGLLEGKSFAAIAREEETSLPSIIARVKSAISKIENYAEQKKYKPKTVVSESVSAKNILADRLNATELQALAAFYMGKDIIKIADEINLPKRDIIQFFGDIRTKLDSLITDNEHNPGEIKKAKIKGRKPRKPYHQALRNAFKAAGIQGSPAASPDAQAFMDAKLTPRQKDVVKLVLKNKSLSDIARKLKVSSPTISLTFKAALIKLEDSKKSEDTQEFDKPEITTRPVQSKYTKHHYALRDVLIKQGITGNPVLSEKFNYLMSMRLTALQQDTVRQIISGVSLEDIARDYNVGKTAVTVRLKAAIEKLSMRCTLDFKTKSSSQSEQIHHDVS
jgi:RNA polymerase sigma-70 factor, ECF subfamily